MSALANINLDTDSLVDRGVDVLTKTELHQLLNDVLAPLELMVVIIIPIVYLLLRKWHLYEEFPASLFRWTLALDFCYAWWLGPFRWLKGNTAYESMAYPTTQMGCHLVVFVDSFCQMGILYTNCVIVSVVFYMVYFGRRFGKKKRKAVRNFVSQLFLVLCFTVPFITALGEVHNYVGWCTADSVAVIFKQLVWFLVLVTQVTMIIPITFILTQGSSSRKLVNSGTLFRFVMILFSQMIGLFPIMCIEFLGLARKPIPKVFVNMIAYLIPAAQIVDITMISVKLWPKFVKKLEDDSDGHCGYIARIAQASEVYQTNQEEIAVDNRSITSDYTNRSFNIKNIGNPKETGGVFLAQAYSQSETCSEDLALYQMVKKKAKKEQHGSDSEGSSGNEDDDDAISEDQQTDLSTTVNQKEPSMFDRIPFWLHLLLTMSIPFLLLLVVSLIMVLDFEEVRTKADVIRKDIVLTTYMADFVHESQKERGATGVYMGSMGKKFACEVLAQHVETDYWQERLQLFLNNKFANVKLVTKSTFLQALINMLRIEDHRTRVVNLSFSKGDGISYYTSMNMYFVGILAQICKDSTLGDTLQHLMFANLAFFSGKEIAGIERAMGSVTFSAGKFESLTAYRKFVSRIAEQETHIWFYHVYVSDDNENFFTEEMDNIAVQITDNMRDKLLSKDNAQILAQSGGEWFHNMTLRINILRGVESKSATELKEQSQRIVNSSTNGMISIVITLAIVLIIDGLMILGLAKTSSHVDKFAHSMSAKRRFEDDKSNKGFCGEIFAYFSKANFVYQVLVPVVACAGGLVVISWLLLQQQVELSQKASETSENTNLQYFLSNFIHESQKERGATGVFMGSNGKDFQPQLDSQKHLTNYELAIYMLFLDEYVDYQNLKGTEYFRSLTASIAIITQHRINSWSQLIPAAAGIGFYTNMNHNIVFLYNEIAVRASGNSVEARLLGYLAFFYMKEKSGNERAVGAGLLGLRVGWEGQESSYRKFVNLVSIQATSFFYFNFFGTEEENNLYIRMMQGKGSKVASAWQATLLEGETSKMVVIDSAYWFGNMTLKINSWRTVESQINSNLVAFFNVVDDRAIKYRFALSAMLIVLFTIAFLVTIKGIRLVLASRAYTLYKQRVREDRVHRRQLYKEQVAKIKQSNAEQVTIKGVSIFI